jgi:hypothetical protein
MNLVQNANQNITEKKAKETISVHSWTTRKFTLQSGR